MPEAEIRSYPDPEKWQIAQLELIKDALAERAKTEPAFGDAVKVLATRFHDADGGQVDAEAAARQRINEAVAAMENLNTADQSTREAVQQTAVQTVEWALAAFPVEKGRNLLLDVADKVGQITFPIRLNMVVQDIGREIAARKSAENATQYPSSSWGQVQSEEWHEAGRPIDERSFPGLEGIRPGAADTVSDVHAPSEPMRGYYSAQTSRLTVARSLTDGNASIKKVVITEPQQFFSRQPGMDDVDETLIADVIVRGHTQADAYAQLSNAYRPENMVTAARRLRGLVDENTELVFVVGGDRFARRVNRALRKAGEQNTRVMVDSGLAQQVRDRTRAVNHSREHEHEMRTNPPKPVLYEDLMPPPPVQPKPPKAKRQPKVKPPKPLVREPRKAINPRGWGLLL